VGKISCWPIVGLWIGTLIGFLVALAHLHFIPPTGHSDARFGEPLFRFAIWVAIGGVVGLAKGHQASCRTANRKSG
jgi:hypothetical protein